jgi:hypothetical protein
MWMLRFQAMWSRRANSPRSGMFRRVSQWISEGKIKPDALVGAG